MTTQKTRKTHTAEFKAEAMKLVERVGVAEAARQLKIYESQLYNWRSAIEKKSTTSHREVGIMRGKNSSKELSAHLLKQHNRDEQIKAIFVQSKERSGARRIQVDLAEDGEYADLKKHDKAEFSG